MDHSSTWNTSAKKLESEEEINEVQSILTKAGIRFKVDVIVPPGEFYQGDDEFSAKKNGTDNGMDGNNEMITNNKTQVKNIEKAVKP